MTHSLQKFCFCIICHVSSLSFLQKFLLTGFFLHHLNLQQLRI